MPLINIGWWPSAPLILLALLCGLDFLLTLGVGLLFRRIDIAHEVGRLTVNGAYNLGALFILLVTMAHLLLWIFIAPYGIISLVPMTAAAIIGNRLGYYYWGGGTR